MDKLTIRINPFVMRQMAIDENGEKYTFELRKMDEFLKDNMPKEVVIDGYSTLAQKYTDKVANFQLENYGETKTKFILN